MLAWRKSNFASGGFFPFLPESVLNSPVYVEAQFYRLHNSWLTISFSTLSISSYYPGFLNFWQVICYSYHGFCLQYNLHKDFLFGQYDCNVSKCGSVWVYSIWMCRLMFFIKFNKCLAIASFFFFCYFLCLSFFPWDANYAVDRLDDAVYMLKTSFLFCSVFFLLYKLVSLNWPIVGFGDFFFYYYFGLSDHICCWVPLFLFHM